MCHANIKVLADSEVEIEDFGSTNGVTVYKLTINEADHLRSKGEEINSKTMTSSWVNSSSFKATPIEVVKKIKIKCPILVEFGESYHLLVL
jgi:hypothetical protein